MKVPDHETNNLDLGLNRSTRSTYAMCGTEQIRVSPDVKAALEAEQLPEESYSDTIERLIEKLEAEIDDAVYDLFELSDEEREVVEAYLEVF